MFYDLKRSRDEHLRNGDSCPVNYIDVHSIIFPYIFLGDKLSQALQLYGFMERAAVLNMLPSASLLEEDQ